jgi:hypothetical protein
MNRDPIPFIEELGYTPREATFLYAVGMHSGYFLRRQFDGYIGRVKGAISQHFLNKAERRGHIRALDYGQNRKVFHLYWKPIYRLLGDEDSQHRRVKGDLCRHLARILKEYQREQDYVEISLNSDIRYNPLNNDPDPYAQAFNIASSSRPSGAKGKTPSGSSPTPIWCVTSLCCTEYLTDTSHSSTSSAR